jgi:hypothetical protein
MQLVQFANEMANDIHLKPVIWIGVEFNIWYLHRDNIILEETNYIRKTLQEYFKSKKKAKFLC